MTQYLLLRASFLDSLKLQSACDASLQKFVFQVKIHTFADLVSLSDLLLGFTFSTVYCQGCLIHFFTISTHINKDLTKMNNAVK